MGGAVTEQIQESAPDGFEVILVDRTSTTPDAKFNFGWFIPAIRRYRSSLLLVLIIFYVALHSGEPAANSRSSTR